MINFWSDPNGGFGPINPVSSLSVCLSLCLSLSLSTAPVFLEVTIAGWAWVEDKLNHLHAAIWHKLLHLLPDGFSRRSLWLLFLQLLPLLLFLLLLWCRLFCRCCGPHGAVTAPVVATAGWRSTGRLWRMLLRLLLLLLLLLLGR